MDLISDENVLTIHGGKNILIT
jgi:hypothetical protein